MNAEEDLLDDLCLLVEVLLLLHNTRGQTMSYPGKELRFRLTLEEEECVGQVFVDLSSHGHL